MDVANGKITTKSCSWCIKPLEVSAEFWPGECEERFEDGKKPLRDLPADFREGAQCSLASRYHQNAIVHVVCITVKCKTNIQSSLLS
jgi:hypothetical protein